MGKAYALLVGLKSVDPDSYGGWDGVNGCWGCELDVDNIERILKPIGYHVRILKTKEATRDKILSALYRTADNTVAGDIFVFYYSGHGGQQPDLNDDESDGKDETLVAYDREVIDDKIHEALMRFKAGVRIVMISDSCNSGSNYRGRRDIEANENAIFRPFAKKSDRDILAQLIHLGGCRDGYSSSGYYGGGAFTMALCEVWGNGTFNGTFKDLHEKICEVISSTQRPQYNEFNASTDFQNQQAFAILSVPEIDDPVELSVIDLSSVKAEISSPGTKHEYKFRVLNDGKYSIETEGSTDLIMKLYGPDDDTKLLLQDDDSGTGKNPKITRELSSGIYYVRIQHYDVERGKGTYSIKVVKE
jgi:hypothetical protein